MQELIFNVKGSSKEPYEVIFIKDGDSLTAICNCPAGAHSNACKHRINIIDGKTAGVVSDNVDQVPTIAEWLPGTDVDEALTALRTLEKDKEASKADISAAKRKLARAMNS